MQMDEVQQDYKQQMHSIISLKTSRKIKKLLLENLISTLKDMQDINKATEPLKSKKSYDVLSTSISECYSVNYQSEKDVEELEERILKLRMVKIENNQDIETMEEELLEMEKMVNIKIDHNDYLKKQIDTKMKTIQLSNHKQEKQKQKQKSVLNKSLDAVAGVLHISKWWT